MSQNTENNSIELTNMSRGESPSHLFRDIQQKLKETQWECEYYKHVYYMNEQKLDESQREREQYKQAGYSLIVY